MTFRRRLQAAVALTVFTCCGALDGGSLHEVPPGYIYKGMVEFTDSPHHQRPHIYMDGASDGDSGPVEGDLETVLVTPDGRMYTKPVSESLELLQSSWRQPAMPAPGDAGLPRAREGASRRLAQTTRVAAPSDSIGVNTSGDLSCNGCGPDNRVQITATTTYPFMTMGQLIGQLGTSNEALECTGTLIGNSHVLTAAHCVFDINGSRRMVSNLNFAPAMDGSSTPYGILAWTQARILTLFSSQPSYTTTAMDNDYALVTLANPATSGYLSLFFPPSNGSTETTTLTTAGYPGSKPSGTMWSSACGSTTIDYSDNNAFANVQQCAGGACANIMTETCITSDGQSGSAMWDTDYKIRGIVTGKVTVSNGDAYNVGTQIDVEVYNQLAAWYNEDTAGNKTLPLAPSGPGAQPSNENAFIKWWNDNWGKSWFIAVFIIVCVTIAGILLIALVQILRCCGCCGDRAQPTKQPNGAYRGSAPPARPYPSYAPSSSPYPPPAPSAPYSPYR